MASGTTRSNFCRKRVKGLKNNCNDNGKNNCNDNCKGKCGGFSSFDSA